MTIEDHITATTFRCGPSCLSFNF